MVISKLSKGKNLSFNTYCWPNMTMKYSRIGISLITERGDISRSTKEQLLTYENIQDFPQPGVGWVSIFWRSLKLTLKLQVFEEKILTFRAARSSAINLSIKVTFNFLILFMSFFLVFHRGKKWVFMYATPKGMSSLSLPYPSSAQNRRSKLITKIWCKNKNEVMLGKELDV